MDKREDAIMHMHTEYNETSLSNVCAILRAQICIQVL